MCTYVLNLVVSLANPSPVYLIIREARRTLRVGESFFTPVHPHLSSFKECHTRPCYTFLFATMSFRSSRAGPVLHMRPLSS